MKNYLSSINDRERWMLLIGGLCLFLYLYYIALYQPLSNRVEQKTTLLVEKIATLKWMKKVQRDVQRTTNKNNLDNNQLLTLLATQLKDHEALKFPYHLQQTASGDIQITFDEVPFRLFMIWLNELTKENAVKVKQLNVDQTNTPGVTRLNIILSALSS